jgi:exodeoxyribonuclease VIII
MINSPLVTRGMSFREYSVRKLGEASNSGLQEFLRSPLHYWQWCQPQPQSDSKAQRRGRMLHAAMFEPDVFARMLPEPDFGDLRTKIGKAAKAEFMAQLSPSATLVDMEDHEAVCRMAQSLRERHPFAGSVCDAAQKAGVTELTVTWAADGIAHKARLDAYPPDLDAVIDLKTCLNASPETFGRDAATYRYDIQAAFYRRACRVAGMPWDGHIFMCVESEPPYAPVCYQLDINAIDAADAEISAALARLATCIDTGNWPGYGDGIQTLFLPAWHMNRPSPEEL